MTVFYIGLASGAFYKLGPDGLFMKSARTGDTWSPTRLTLPKYVRELSKLEVRLRNL